jgi:hypothetical protein
VLELGEGLLDGVQVGGVFGRAELPEYHYGFSPAPRFRYSSALRNSAQGNVIRACGLVRLYPQPRYDG